MKSFKALYVYVNPNDELTCHSVSESKRIKYATCWTNVNLNIEVLDYISKLLNCDLNSLNQGEGRGGLWL
jgi:hypothetical protein